MKLLFVIYVSLLISLGMLLIYFGVSEKIAASTTFVLIVLGSILSLLFSPRKAQN